MSKSPKASPSQPSSSPPAIPDHLLPVFELINRLDSIECWRIGAPIFLDLGVVEPTLFRDADPQQIGEMFRAQIKPSVEWFRIAEDLGRFVTDHKMLSVALMRIAAVRLVGT
jgi:hypothetical protein